MLYLNPNGYRCYGQLAGRSLSRWIHQLPLMFQNQQHNVSVGMGVQNDVLTDNMLS